MSDFIDSEAEESEEEELDERQKKKIKKSKSAAIVSDEDDDEEEDDEEKLREELGDLIDDNPIEEDESSGSESGDDKSGGTKRKRDDDDDELDDNLSEEDFELLEENLGIKVKRKKTFVRVKRIADDDSDDEGARPGHERDAIANELFEGSDGEEDPRQRREKERSRREDDEEKDQDKYSEEEDEDEEDIGDFIVDAEGQPIHGKKKKRKAIYTDAALQEAQDIFGVDFDYDDVNRDGEEYEEDEDEDEEYDDEDGVRKTRKKADGKIKKKSQRKTIYDVYEPSELERGHFTDLDEQIRKLDMPERMQLRHVPITSVEEGSNELDLEAEWIYKFAFFKASISKQDESVDGQEKAAKSPQTVEKIKKALEFMRNQHLEVPFIAFYRKEYVLPELTVNDLWRVYKFDEKWTQLQTRKRNMLRLFEKMHKYQSERLTRDVNESIPENVRVLRDEDMDRLRGVQSLEELNDVYSHFILYYGNDVPAMQEAHRLKEREMAKERRQAAARRKQAEDGGEPMDVDDADVDLLDLEDVQIDEESTVKQARRSDLYSLCAKAGLDGLLRKYGLSPQQFAENLRDNYQRHEVEQYPSEPLDAALDYVSPKFPTPAEVIKATNYMMAVQIGREPLVRQCVREAFYERARIDVVPTKQGLKEIDENHVLYPFKFVKDKPVRELTEDQYLRLANGEQDKLITVTILTGIEGATTASYADEVKALFQRDEFSKLVQDWNDLRNQVVDVALNKIVFPALVKELKSKLMNEAREFVLRSCCQQLYNWLKVAPYKVDEAMENDEDWDTKNGLRVMALSYVDELDQAAFGCLLSGDGECTDHIRLEHILKRKNAWKESDKAGKEKDLRSMREFLYNKKPHVIVVSGESRDALMLIEDLKALVAQLIEDEQWPMINVELIDNNLAKVFASSSRAEVEFREYPSLLREAISLARRVQDPLIEFSQLCNNDEEIGCLKYHALQDQLSREELLEGLNLEFVNRTNEVGVDINRAINYPHTANLVQFVCGLGPRKGQALIKILKQNNQRLENRTQLVTACHMGPKVFINCSGFIKIDTNSLGDSTESYVEILDGSRVHPETYEWARKMAVDALEYDDEDANPAGAVEEILESPDRLKDLDLDAFADELERQGFGNKRITLYDIRSELNCRYKDARQPFEPPDPEQTFNMLTKETPQTFYIGKLVMATVTGFMYRKPDKEALDNANPNRNDQTGLWQCPFCLQNDFPDLSEVWNHFDAGACPGKSTGVRIRLENGLNGFIQIKSLSDSEVTNPEERVRPGQTIHCRVTKIEVDKFNVQATSKSSDLMDRNGEWRPPKDDYYDNEAEQKIQQAEEEAKKLKQRQSYTKRVIVHPSFKNIGFREAEKLMMAMDQGEVIVRPSSKGTNHLTVTWKVGDGVCQHVDVREEGKENAFSLGQSLWIGDEEFEDLDEIVARYINPMAGHARDVYAFRYFRDLGIDMSSPVEPGKERERADKIIKDDKAKNPAKIHYFLSASREFPGKFMLSYLPRGHTKHEFVTVTPEGFRFRGQVHDSLPTLFRWFKEHFRDPIPGSTPRSSSAVGHHGSSSRTPGGFQTGTTPNVNPETLHRVAQSIPAHMLASLSHAAQLQGTPTAFGGGGYPANTPYTPSGQTPFMTPFATTPHQPQTPRYSGSTPAPSAASSTTAPGTFRTPAAPGVHRGYGAQSYSSNRGGGGSSNRNSQGQQNRNSASDDWGAVAAAPSVSRSAAPASSEPDDWSAAADAWASTTSSRSKTAASSNRTPVVEDWGAADAWASGGTSAKTTPRSSSAAGDWGASPASGGNNRGRTTPSSNRGTPAPSADDWGVSDPVVFAPTSNSAAADEWAGVSSNPPAPKPAAADAWGSDSWGSSNSTSNSTKPSDDWGSSNSNSWSNNGSSSRGGRGGGSGGSRACFKCNQEGHMSRECPNPSTGGGRGGYGGSRGGGRGGGSGGSRACFKCNQEGHMSRDCPNPSSGGGSRGGRDSSGGGWNSSYSSRPGSAASGTQSSSTAAASTDDWGAEANAPVVAAVNSSAADDWASIGSESTTAPKSTAPTGTTDWDTPDPWATGSSQTAAKSTSNSDWGAKTDDWSSSKSSSGGAGASKSTFDDWGSSSSPAANSSKPSDDWSSSSSNTWSTGANSASRGRGGGGGGSGRGCFKCGEEGHMSRECPSAGSGGGRGRGGPVTCYKCGEEGHMSRECTNPSSSGGRGGRGGFRGGRGGGGGEGASRACFKCNEEGHMSRDCPKPSSGGGRSQSNNDWGSSTSSGASGFGKGANTEPLGVRQRSSSKPSTPANDDWGTASGDTNAWTSSKPSTPGNDDWGTSASSGRSATNAWSSSKPSTPANDDWGTGASSGRAASSASNKTAAADDWGVSDPWGSSASSSNNNRNGMDRSRSNRPSSTASADVWDTEGPVVAAPSKDASDDWGVTGSSSSSSARRGSRTPMDMGQGDATPLYDE